MQYRQGRVLRDRPNGARKHCVLVWCLLAMSIPPEIEAQTIRGQLRDVDSDQPIALGVLTLLSNDRTVIRSVMSDEHGNWALQAPRPGSYYITAERLGYQSWTAGPLEIGAQVELSSVFHLKRAPVALDPIEARAVALRRHLDASGFFERQRGNFGHFIAPEDIDRRAASRLTDLLVSVPGVQRIPVAGGSVGPAQIQLRGSSLSQGGFCRPRVFVDGLMYSRGDSRPVRLREGLEVDRLDEAETRMDQALSIDDIGHPSTIAAIEIYRSASQVPVQFGGGSVETLCGVVVIWTRTGRARYGGSI